MSLAGKVISAVRVLRNQGMAGLSEFMRRQTTGNRPDERQPEVNRGGEGIVNLVDVGSTGGLSPEWRRNADRIRFLLNFEPREPLNVEDNILTLNTALWSETCTRDFHIYKGFKGSGSSLFMQNYDYVRQEWENLQHRGPAELANTWFDRSELVRTQRVACRTLDEVIEEHVPGVAFDFMKIDAQGAEYEILRGAQRLLEGSCSGLLLELFVLPLYRGIRLLPDVEAYLHERGFRLVKKFPPHGTFDSQHNCLFLREGGHGTVMDIIHEVYGL